MCIIGIFVTLVSYDQILKTMASMHSICLPWSGFHVFTLNGEKLPTDTLV